MTIIYQMRRLRPTGLARLAARTSTLVAALACATSTWAATAAYWRHEGGPAGSLVPDGPNTVLDSSGNGNHMQTLSSAFDPYTAATYTTSVSPLALRSGLSNTLSLDFGAGSDGIIPEGNEPNDDNYTQLKPIDTQLFTAMTVELAFNMKSVGAGQYQALFGKDGKPLGDAEGEPDSPVPPFKMIVRGDGFPGDIPNQLAVEWIDGDGDVHLVASGETIAVNTWYHVAFTLTSSDAQLWLAGQTGAYTMKDSISGEDFAAGDGRVIIAEPLGYSIGRGAFNNGATDWANALIDEVKISDAALLQNQFEFLTTGGTAPDFDGNHLVDGNDALLLQRGTPTNASLQAVKDAFGQPAIGAVPEPTAVALLAFGMAGLSSLRRKQATT